MPLRRPGTGAAFDGGRLPSHLALPYQQTPGILLNLWSGGLGATADAGSANYEAAIEELIGKIVGYGPVAIFLALVILVGLPILLMKVPETIREIGTYHDTHRKTTHKIKMDRAKLNRSLADRKAKKGGTQ